MHHIDQPQEQQLNRLLTELGFSLEAPKAQDEATEVFFFAGCEPAVEPDVRQTRILDQTQRWIRFLSGQAEQLTGAASQLYEQLLSALPAGALAAETDDESRAAMIDRLEWTLGALEVWIEEQQPSDGRGRFRIRWTSDDDGIAFWGGPDELPATPMSLQAIVRDGAEHEGGLSIDLAHRVASLIVAGLRSGQLRLLRTYRILSESRPEESVFEMLPRGEAYLTSIAMEEELASAIPAELEAGLAEGESRRFAAALDDTSYGAARAAQAGASASGRGIETTIAQRVEQVARICRMGRSDALRCLLAMARQQLDIAVQASDQAATRRLGRAVTELAALILAAP